MRTVYDLVDLRPVIAAARQLAFADQTLDAYLPSVNVADVDYRLGRGDRVDQTVPPRAFDTPAPIIARPGAVEVRGGLPAFSAMDLLTETDLVRARRLAGLPVDLMPTVIGAAGRVTATIQNTVQLLKGQALSTGAISLNSNGVVQAVDFGVPAGNKVTAGTAWTSAAAPALTDLINWHDAYVAASGGPAGVILTSSRVRRLLTRNTQIINAVAGSTVGRTSVNVDELNGLLATEGLPPIRTFDRSLRNFDGTLTRVIADNRLIMLPDGGTTVGQTQFGITEEAVELVANRVLGAGDAPGIAVVTMLNDEPVQRAVKAAAIGMPVINEPQSLLTAAVA